ncbi:hypothetical protein N1851_024889 [Merluccius polli]|uniref:Uncharacterized protein n=1 Tax=Merluccius polli TaxID=89951 RepID=A0AA47NWF2_MERPO|nr:hypothetical protein N1851_024889 [Merluccius polli]
MLIRLDIFHWIHRFDAALRTAHHPKYALFKSVLSGAVFSYNRDDVALLLHAIRAGHPTKYGSLTDGELMETHVTKSDLSHYVRRITVGAQETFMRVQSAIGILKGAAGMDENQVHLFKDEAAIDHVWENQQKHLECIQDPPGQNMYTIKKHVTRNGVRLPYYTTVYLLAGITRWNSDKESASVRGQKGRKHMVYPSPLVHRLNQQCQELFGEVEEVNFRPPVPAGDERIGLEYLQQSHSTLLATTLRPGRHSRKQRMKGMDAPADTEESPVKEEVEEAADAGFTSDREGDTLTPLRKNISLTNQAVVAELDPCVEDVCGPNHLPGYEHIEELSKVLVDIALEEGKLAISNATRQKVIAAWNKLDLHNRNIQQFDSLYSARWGNTLFSRTDGDPAELSLIQKLKFSKRYSAAHLLDSRKKQADVLPHQTALAASQLWRQGSRVTAETSGDKDRVTVDDAELSKLGIPILKINSKQEASSARNVTDHRFDCPPLTPLKPQRQNYQRKDLTPAGLRWSMRSHHLWQEQDCLKQESPVPSPFVLNRHHYQAKQVSKPPSPVRWRCQHPNLCHLPCRRLPRGLLSLQRDQRSTKEKEPSRQMKVYLCALCGQPTQGHKKYRKKTFCEVSKSSTSQGCSGKTFETFRRRLTLF